jgi:hypothetical protein
MDANRIKDLLHAWRPGQDVPPEVAQAREAASADPELTKWLENERAFDQAFANKLRSVQAPPDLLGKILASHNTGEGKILGFPQPEAPAAKSDRSRVIRYAVSIAAALTIVSGVFFFATRNSAAEDDLDSFVNAMVVRAMSDDLSRASDMTNVVKGLQSHHAPVPGDLPSDLAKYTPASYGVIETQNGNVGQIAFSGGESYRLLVLERRCLGGCSKKLTKPVMFDLGDKLAVSWAKGNQVFILVGDRSGEKTIESVAKETGTSF